MKFFQLCLLRLSYIQVFLICAITSKGNNCILILKSFLTPPPHQSLGDRKWRQEKGGMKEGEERGDFGIGIPKINTKKLTLKWGWTIVLQTETAYHKTISIVRSLGGGVGHKVYCNYKCIDYSSTSVSKQCPLYI